MLSALVYSQFWPGQSWLHRSDPRSKLVWLALFTLLLFLTHKLSTQLILAGILLALPILLRLPRRLIWPAFLGVMPLALLTLLWQALGSTPRDWGWLSFAGCERGGLTGLRLLALAVAAQLMALTTSPLALCEGLEWMMRPLGKVGLPYRDLALAFTIAWRFIPVLAVEGERLLKAQMARGACWDEGPLRRRLLTLVGLLTPLLLRCFRYAEELALALEARGYGQSRNPTRLRPLQFRRVDAVLMLSAWVLLVLVLVWESRG